jgi:hypothetical protein
LSQIIEEAGFGNGKMNGAKWDKMRLSEINPKKKKTVNFLICLKPLTNMVV